MDGEAKVLNYSAMDGSVQCELKKSVDESIPECNPAQKTTDSELLEELQLRRSQLGRTRELLAAKGLKGSRLAALRNLDREHRARLAHLETLLEAGVRGAERGKGGPAQ